MEENKTFEEEIKNDVESGACEENAPKKEKKSSKKDKSAELLGKIAELEGKIAEGNDKYLRMAAEYDNFRRRSREEKSATYETALSDAVTEFLPIIDNLERAAAIEAEGALKEGVVMIMKSVGAVLQKLGVESYGAPGDKFDPELHNAVMHDEDDSGRESEITDVFQTGYKHGTKIIRFAMVKTVN